MSDLQCDWTGEPFQPVPQCKRLATKRLHMVGLERAWRAFCPEHCELERQALAQAPRRPVIVVGELP